MKFAVLGRKSSDDEDGEGDNGIDRIDFKTILGIGRVRSNESSFPDEEKNLQRFFSTFLTAKRRKPCLRNIVRCEIPIGVGKDQYGHLGVCAPCRVGLADSRALQIALLLVRLKPNSDRVGMGTFASIKVETCAKLGDDSTMSPKMRIHSRVPRSIWETTLLTTIRLQP